MSESQFFSGTSSWWYYLAKDVITICAVLVASAYFFRQEHSSRMTRENVETSLAAGKTTTGSGTWDAMDESTSDPGTENLPKKLLDKSEYTVGWICAIRPEYKAAQLFLDEKHEVPDDIPQRDDNDYTLGKIGKHCVAIAVLPNGVYGTTCAANVAKDMMNTFTNIRIGLMVGIAGGAPSQRHDIRLGDVVVSTGTGRNSGVLQYDFGKSIQDQTFIIQGSLRPPPTFLQTAVAGLDVDYQDDGHNFDKTIREKIRGKPRLQIMYGKPDQRSDRLFKPNVRHPANEETSCEAVCNMRDEGLVQRAERSELENDPAIHYGVIASGNSLMKDAIFRDKLSAREDILCFEMEAAGLMDQFPCLVIRGICDYADTHKNKKWQGYAAMMAAAYARDLLCRIPPKSVETEKRISEVLRGLQHVEEAQLAVSQKQLEMQEDAAKREQSIEQKQCLQLFRLTEGNNDTTYEWYKNRVEGRVEGTCEWFLQHPNFLQWLQQDSGLLLVTADPGCGKSVLAKYLIDHGLPRSSTICYYFFKEQDQNKVRQALCALLHQLFSQIPALISHAMPQLQKDGQGLINSTQSLWTILENAVKDPQAGRIILVLDALDECASLELENLVRNVESQIGSHQSNHGRFKYLLTTRPYEQVTSKFRDLLVSFPNIRIPGEEESETISKEVDRVIKHRVNQLRTADPTRDQMEGLSPESKRHLEKRLQETTHRTYLWIYLVFNYLEKEDFKKTTKGVDYIIADLPRSINEAYEQILNKSKEHPMVWKALCVILAASRPLTLAEMNIAMNIDDKAQYMHDLDLEGEENFKARLRYWCGLFVSIHHGKIYFLHQTAREFLLADLSSPTTIQSGLRWHHCITTREAHTVLAEICVLYLNFFNSDVSILTNADRESCDPVDSYSFLDYSAKNWGSHFREANIKDKATIVPYALTISDPNSRSYAAWFQIWGTTIRDRTDFTDLMVAAYFGHRAVVRLLLEQNAVDVEAKDSKYGQTPLLWAARKGHEVVVRLLIETGADIEAKDGTSGQTPLSWAALNGYEAVAKLLLEKGADIEAKDSKYGQTPLLWAVRTGHEAVVKLLLKKGANVEAMSSYGQTPLSVAAKSGQEAVVGLLLQRGVDIEAKDGDFGRTPLLWVAKRGQEAMVKLLLEKGADIEAKDSIFGLGQTSLSLAAESGHETVVTLLLKTGAYVDAKDSRYGRTPLSFAAEAGHETVVTLLLENGAYVDAKDNMFGRTPLSFAAKSGHVPIVRLLLENDADAEAKDSMYGQTPLSFAVKSGHGAVVRLLQHRCR